MAKKTKKKTVSKRQKAIADYNSRVAELSEEGESVGMYCLSFDRAPILKALEADGAELDKRGLTAETVIEDVINHLYENVDRHMGEAISLAVGDALDDYEVIEEEEEEEEQE